MTVAAVIVTFRRPDSLAETLDAVWSQSVPPDWVIVVDNDGDDALGATLPPRTHHLAMPDNVGYGAGLHEGMRYAAEHHDPDWFWLLDDDTPPSAAYLADSLALAGSDPEPSVIATRGGWLHHGRIRHMTPPRGRPVVVDFALVDGALISRRAVRRSGLPRQDLFMMFEDAEYTTRIAEAGGVVLVRPAQVDARHLGSGAGSAWRSYYQARNHLRIALDRRSAAWLWGWAYRMTVLSATDVRHRRWDVLRLRWRGALDGLRGKMGRTLAPGAGATSLTS